MVVEVTLGDEGARVDWSFRPLPARPLVRHTLSVAAYAEDDLERQLQVLIAGLPADAVLTIRVEGTFTEGAARVFSAARLRALAPATMNVDVRPASGFGREPDLDTR